MAHALDSRANSPANDLRDALDQVERLVVTPTPETVENLLTLLDKIKFMFQELTTAGVDLRPEEGRWEGIRSRLDSRPSAIVAAANGAGGLAKLRVQNPPAEEMWWQLDQIVNERRQRAIVKAVRFGVVGIAILLVLYYGINFFFPPSQEAIFVLESVATIEDSLIENDLEQAHADALSAAIELPTEPELWLWSAVLAEQIGNEKQAADSLQKAQDLLMDRPIILWIELGNRRLQLSDFEGAKAAADEALAIDVQSAQAHFLLGSIAELEGDKRAAIDYFEKTFDLAEEDEPQLAVIAKVRMGNLLQSLDPFETPPPVEEGTQTGS
ncbi:MAG: tetratricopeptide repeat protein [Chloroflexota bacterium]